MRGIYMLFAGALLTACGAAGAMKPGPAEAPLHVPAFAESREAGAGPSTEASAVRPGAPPRLGLASCAKGRLDVSFAEVRRHPRAAWIEAVLVNDPRYGELAIPGKVDPFKDGQEVRFCTERFGGWGSVRMRHGLPEALVDEAAAVYGTRVDRGGPLDLGVPGARAWKVRVGSDVWTLVRARPGEVLFVVPEDAIASSREYAASPPVALAPGVAVALFADEPRARFPGVLPEVSRLGRLDLTLTTRADGSAELSGVGEAGDEAQAREIALALTRRAEEAASSFMVRIVTRGLLDGLSIKARGPRIELRLPATGPQVDSVLSFVAASLGVRLDRAAASSPPSGSFPEDAGRRY